LSLLRNHHSLFAIILSIVLLRQQLSEMGRYDEMSVLSF